MRKIKPIFIIRFPNTIDNEIVNDVKNKIVETQTDLLKEYHILVMKDIERVGEVQFEIYNSDCTEIEFKELQDKLLKNIQYEQNQNQS